MFKATTLIAAAAAAFFVAPTLAADLDRDAEPTRRHMTLIGRPIQFTNPANDLRVVRIDRDAPYALTGDVDTRPEARVQVLRVGSRQVPIGLSDR